MLGNLLGGKLFGIWDDVNNFFCFVNNFYYEKNIIKLLLDLNKTFVNKFSKMLTKCSQNFINFIKFIKLVK